MPFLSLTCARDDDVVKRDGRLDDLFEAVEQVRVLDGGAAAAVEQVQHLQGGGVFACEEEKSLFCWAIVIGWLWLLLLLFLLLLLLLLLVLSW